MQKRLRDVGHNIQNLFPPEKCNVRRVVTIFGVAGIAVVMSLGSVLDVFPTDAKTPTPTIRITILPTPLGPYDQSLKDCLGPLITKNSFRCLGENKTPIPQ